MTITTTLSSLVVQTPFSLLAVLLGTIIFTSYVQAYLRLRHFPGPWLGSFSYLWMFKSSVSGRHSFNMLPLNEKYNSPLVRIGPNDLITNDPTMIKRMSAARSTYLRSSWYNSMKMDPYHDSLFSIHDTTKHDKLKAKMAAGYSGREVPSMEGDIDRQLESLVALLRREYLTVGENLVKVDMVNIVSYFTLDVLTKLAFGKEFGFLEKNKDMINWQTMTRDVIPSLALFADIPYLERLFMSQTALAVTGPKKTDPVGGGKADGHFLFRVADEVVQNRFGPDAEDQRDMLGSFVRHGVSKRDCETEACFQVVAGADTTASAIRLTLLHLMTTPHVYNRLQKEIDAAMEAGKLSNPVKAEESKKLEYLQAVILEGMRMRPQFTGLVMKEAPPEGDTYNGMFIPGGTRIGHNTFALLRNKGVFGQDAEVFRPERWLDSSDEMKTQMTSAVDLVFGYGRWGCAGKNVALMELQKIFVELLRNFDLQIVNPAQPWTEKNHHFYFHQHMFAKITARN